MNSTSFKTSNRAATVRNLAFCALSILVMAIIAWFYFMPNITQGEILRQGDIVQGVANGQEYKAYMEQTGEKSWWTNALFGGMPTFQIAPSYESTKWLGWVQKVYTLGFPQPVSLVFMMMLGFFIFMLACDCKWYLALLGAIAYAFSSYFFIIIHAGHIWKVLTLAYIPPTLAGIVLAYRGKYLAGAALAALFAALQLMSNHVQMTYYSAFIIVALVIGYLIKAFADKKLKQWTIATLALALAAGLALAANAPNLFMTYKYSQETMRGGHSELTPLPADNADTPAETPTSSGLTKEYITQWSYGVDETLTLLVPNAKGGSSEHALAEVDSDQTENLGQLESQALAIFPDYFGDQPFTSGPVYVGIIIFALFLLGCIVVKGPVKWALLAVTILTVMLSWGHNFMGLTDFFIDHFPMYNKFRTISSILVVAELTMPLLAVLALKEMFARDDFFTRHRTAIFAAFGVTALLCLALAIAPSIMGGGVSDAEASRFNAATGGEMTIQQVPDLIAAVAALRHGLVAGDAWRSLVFLLLSAAVIFVYMKMSRGTKADGRVALVTGSALALAVLVLADMYLVNKRYLNEDDFVEAESVEQVALQPRPADTEILRDTTMNYRVLDLENFMRPDASFFHKTVGGYHAAKLTRYNDLIERQLVNNNVQVLNMLNTKYIISSADKYQQNPDALGNAWFVDSLTYVDTPDKEMAFLDRFNAATSAVADAKFKTALGEAVPTQAGDTIYETSYAPNRLTYRAHSANGGVAVFSEIFFPWGWNVTIDGKPAQLGRVNYVLRALRVPAGDHTIAMDFHPTEIERNDNLAKCAIAAIFALMLAAGAVYALRRRKPAPSTDANN